MTTTGQLRAPHNRLSLFRACFHLLLLTAISLAISAAASAQDSSEVQPGQSSKPPDNSPDQSPPSLFTPLKVTRVESPYTPINRRQRLRWFLSNTFGPPHLVGGLFTSAIGTALDHPTEYGTHWGGFADRYGMRMTGIVTGNAIEVTAGYFVHEDPRYFRVPDQPFKSRLKNVVRLTFVARHDDGTFGPAYARYMAISGNNFLSNSWRASSEANTQDALLRTAEGFAGRMSANAFEEFWPDAKQFLFHRRQ